MTIKPIHENKYRIQILDATSDQIMFFDRVKTSYGGHRIITSREWGRTYPSKEAAEQDARMIQQYYTENCIVEVVEIT